MYYILRAWKVVGGFMGRILRVLGGSGRLNASHCTCLEGSGSLNVSYSMCLEVQIVDKLITFACF